MSLLICFSSSQLKVFYPHRHCYKTVPRDKKSHVPTYLLKALQRIPSSSKMQENYKLSSWFLWWVFSCAFPLRIPFLFPHKHQPCVLVLGKLRHVTWQSLSLLLMFSPVSLSPVALIVKADGLIWPSLEVVDAVETTVMMFSDKGPLITWCCQRNNHILALKAMIMFVKVLYSGSNTERLSVEYSLYLRFMQAILGTSHRPSPRQRIIGMCLWIKPVWHWYLTRELTSYLSRFLPKVRAFSTRGGWLQATEKQKWQ